MPFGQPGPFPDFRLVKRSLSGSPEGTKDNSERVSRSGGIPWVTKPPTSQNPEVGNGIQFLVSSEWVPLAEERWFVLSVARYAGHAA